MNLTSRNPSDLWKLGEGHKFLSLAPLSARTLSAEVTVGLPASTRRHPTPRYVTRPRPHSQTVITMHHQSAVRWPFSITLLLDYKGRYLTHCRVPAPEHYLLPTDKYFHFKTTGEKQFSHYSVSWNRPGADLIVIFPQLQRNYKQGEKHISHFRRFSPYHS